MPHSTIPKLLMALFLAMCTSLATAETFVSQHGRLQVNGSKLVDKNGDTIQLRGSSLFWSQWGGSFYNAKTVNWLAKDWRITVIRAAMGVDGTNSGYMVDSATEVAKVDSVVAAAVKAGIYVIIDWHDNDANLRTNEAKAFFAEMSRKYGNLPNVMYEIWNEPQSTPTWTGVIKPYAEQVIPAIRANDPDNLIIVGTRNWSQNVNDVIGHTIQDPNVAYSLHFYVGTHGAWLRTIGDQAINAGIPIFVTEWGIWSDGYVSKNYKLAVDTAQANAWMTWLESRKVSSCMWEINDKDEPSSNLKPGTSPTGSWTTADLTTAGTFIRTYLLLHNTGTWTVPDSSTPTLTIRRNRLNESSLANARLDLRFDLLGRLK